MPSSRSRVDLLATMQSATTLLELAAKKLKLVNGKPSEKDAARISALELVEAAGKILTSKLEENS